MARYKFKNIEVGRIKFVGSNWASVEKINPDAIDWILRVARDYNIGRVTFFAKNAQTSRASSSQKYITFAVRDMLNNGDPNEYWTVKNYLEKYYKFDLTTFTMWQWAVLHEATHIVVGCRNHHNHKFQKQLLYMARKYAPLGRGPKKGLSVEAEVKTADSPDVETVSRIGSFTDLFDFGETSLIKSI